MIFSHGIFRAIVKKWFSRLFFLCVSVSLW